MGETMQQIEGLEMRMLAESGSLQSQTMRNLGHNSISLQCVFRISIYSSSASLFIKSGRSIRTASVASRSFGLIEVMCDAIPSRWST